MPDPTAPDEPPLAAVRAVKAASVEPSFTARIDGVEMDFWSVRMRGDSHLLGSCDAPGPDPGALELVEPIAPVANFADLAGNAGIN